MNAEPLNTNEILTILAGVLHVLPAEERAKVVRAVNEHEALKALEKAAAEAVQAANFGGHSAERRLMEIEPRLRAKLAELAKVREVAS